MTDYKKIDAAIKTLEEERVRWLLGKKNKLTTSENVFGNVITEGRYNVILVNAANDEFERNLILGELERGEKTIHELADATGIPKKALVRHIISLRKWRKIEEAGVRGQSPLYKLRS